MILILAKSTVKPDYIETFKQHTQELVEKSQAEAGCLSYELFQDLTDPTQFVFVEKWLNQAAIDAHNESDHFKTIVPKLADLRVGPSSVKFYELA